VVVGFRIVGACWLVLLSVLTLLEDSEAVAPGATEVIVSTMAIAVVWTAVTVLVAYRRPKLLHNWAFLIVDLAVATWIAMTPGIIDTDIFFAGGYPISSPILIATVKGLVPTILPALIVAAASAVGVIGPAGARAAEVLAINFLSPLVVAWGFDTIKRQDERRRQAEEALAAERTKLARADERAEMAAHLHDSVLQTLALIQRRAPENKAVTRLARRQERELRTWLNGGPPLASGATLAGALIRASEEVEDEYDIIVEVSTVGDRPLDDNTSGLVLAAREAMTNAARFAGVDRIFVLCEAGHDDVRLVVRDQGVGFDLNAVSPERRGIRESIAGRMERLGGEASVSSSPESGTEVELLMANLKARP
jgi:signal transduction histidine kinase